MHTVGITTSTADRKRRAGQRLIIGIQGTSLREDERRLIHEMRPGGFVLFKRNIEEPRQLRELNRELASLLPDDIPPIRCVDQEGGRVQRFKAPATVWPPMRWVGNVGRPGFSRAIGAALARECHAVGFDLDFAPDADVDSNPKNPIIGDRAFGRGSEDVARHVAAFIEGMQGEGVIACAKHFPGHGDTATDSHLELPTVEKDLPELEHVEIPPFKASIAAGVGTIMTAHVVYPAWDADVPATMSPRILKTLLREKLGFDGVLISDDLEMKAVRGRYPLGQQLEAASRATVDVFLVCSEIGLQVEAWEGLIRLQEEDKVQEDLAIYAVGRWHRMRRRFLLGRPEQPGLDVLGCQAHLDLALRAQAEGMA